MATLAADLYWKIRAAVADAARLELEAQLAMAQAEGKKREALEAAGLNPAQSYRLDDATLTAEPVEESGRG
jgi:hypothetical protein